MNLSKQIRAIRQILELSQSQLAEKLQVTYETINRWENEKTDVDDNNIEKVYSFSYEKGIDINLVYEQIYKEEYENEENLVLFHGCKNCLSLPLDLLHSKKNNDFGIGFYLGENLAQAAMYIANGTSNKVYSFIANVSNLKIKKFTINNEWMITIALFRGWLDDYINHELIKGIINDISEYDLLIAPIADNKMFDIISEFIRGEITDLQAEHALAATNLGQQYVFRTNKALEKLELINEYYISKPEKNAYISKRVEMNNLCQDKVKVARIDYRGKGHYIDELLK